MEWNDFNLSTDTHPRARSPPGYSQTRQQPLGTTLTAPTLAATIDHSSTLTLLTC